MIRVKLNFNNFANQTIREINSLVDLLDKNDIDHEFFSAADVGFDVLGGYLIDISKRAIELNDQVLLDALKGIGAVSEESEVA